MVANSSAQGHGVNSTESGIQDGSNHTENHPVSQQGAISGLRNLKRKMEEIYLEWAAFKIEQSNLKKEVSTVMCSLTKMTEGILRIRRDMTQIITSLNYEIAEIKNLLLNMSANKRGRKQRIHKDTEVALTSSAEQGGKKSMEVYDEIAHDMETSWNSMCESESERDTSARMRVSQGYSTPIQNKPAGVY
jgi:hypothetical protein